MPNSRDSYDNRDSHDNHQTIQLDAVIIGGGIAGLFTLAKLRRAGYQAVLLEADALGSGQTIKSQGIIHGGTKYTLLGKPSTAQQQIAAMPSYWRECLNGTGDIDLSATEVLADKQCMWAMPNLSSAITGFFAGRLMQSHVQTLTDLDRPTTLQHADCRGQFYALDEPVLNVRSLLQNFADRYGEFILTDCTVRVMDTDYHADHHDNHDSYSNANNTNTSIRIEADNKDAQWQFETQKLIVTAGEGNRDFLPSPDKQQLRPLRMVVADVPRAFGQLFVHILEASDKPRLTISSYPHPDDEQRLMWYLGGNLAEKGAQHSHEATIAKARQELNTLFPWLDGTSITFDSFSINRAEAQSGGKRPDTPTVIAEGNRLIAYPTKLALAPLLADELTQKISDLTPIQTTVHPCFPPPRVASFPWEHC